MPIHGEHDLRARSSIHGALEGKWSLSSNKVYLSLMAFSTSAIMMYADCSGMAHSCPAMLWVPSWSGFDVKLRWTGGPRRRRTTSLVSSHGSEISKGCPSVLEKLRVNMSERFFMQGALANQRPNCGVDFGVLHGSVGFVGSHDALQIPEMKTVEKTRANCCSIDGLMDLDSR